MTVKHDIPEVTIKLPSGNPLTISVNSLEKKENSVLASVIKDGGDDPDVTHGLVNLFKGELTERFKK